MCFLLLRKRLDEMKDKTVCITGLGYVGLSLAKAFVIEKEINLCNPCNPWLVILWFVKGGR